MYAAMKLTAYLEQENLTQKDFAALVGCEQPTIGRYCAGRVPEPGVMKRIILVTCGKVTPNDWFEEEISPDPDKVVA